MKWALLALVAAAIGVSFFVEFGDEAEAVSAPKGPRAWAVAIAKVAVEPVVERAAYPGELDADAADVAALYAGRLDAVHVRLGDRVAAGDRLAAITIVDLGEQRSEAEAAVSAARAEIRRVRAELDNANREAGRLDALGEAALVAKQEADSARARARALAAEAQRAQAALAEAEARVALLGRRETESAVVAPFAGQVVERWVDPGGFVSTGTRLVRLVQSDVLRVRFEVPEQDVPEVALGAEVEVSVPALGDERAPARVTGIAGEVLRDRRVVMVEAIFDRRPAGWLPGMYASASVVHRKIERTPVVPEAALLTRIDPEGGTRVGVFRRDGGVARWVPVEVVGRADGRVAVRGDVAADAEVLVQGHHDLADGAAIRVSTPADGPGGDASAPEVRL